MSERLYCSICDSRVMDHMDNSDASSFECMVCGARVCIHCGDVSTMCCWACAALGKDGE